MKKVLLVLSLVLVIALSGCEHNYIELDDTEEYTNCVATVTSKYEMIGVTCEDDKGIEVEMQYLVYNDYLNKKIEKIGGNK